MLFEKYKKLWIFNGQIRVLFKKRAQKNVETVGVRLNADPPSKSYYENADGNQGDARLGII